MAKFIEASDIALAWLGAMEHLKATGGKESNLIVAIAPNATEEPSIRKKFDEFLAQHESPTVRRIRKVADTIFPIDFYKPAAGPKAQDHLYEMQRYARVLESREVGSTYFDRLIDWEGKEGLINQLKIKIKHLKKAWEGGKRNGSAYELALSTVEEDVLNESDGQVNLRIQDPAKDNSIMGFPCLSHISLTLFNGRLDMTAVYRNQYFITKAYGNYIGLLDLLGFICHEVGCQAGELVCVATHADAELGLNGLS